MHNALPVWTGGSRPFQNVPSADTDFSGGVVVASGLGDPATAMTGWVHAGGR
jgi:hypothetical protein